MSKVSNAFADLTGIGETTASKNSKIAKNEQSAAQGTAQAYAERAIAQQQELYEMLKPLYEKTASSKIGALDNAQMMFNNSMQGRDPVIPGQFSLPARVNAPPVVAGSFQPRGQPQQQATQGGLPQWLMDLLAGGQQQPQQQQPQPAQDDSLAKQMATMVMPEDTPETQWKQHKDGDFSITTTGDPSAQLNELFASNRGFTGLTDEQIQGNRDISGDYLFEKEKLKSMYGSKKKVKEEFAKVLERKKASGEWPSWTTGLLD